MKTRRTAFLQENFRLIKCLRVEFSSVFIITFFSSLVQISVNIDKWHLLIEFSTCMIADVEAITYMFLFFVDSNFGCQKERIILICFKTVHGGKTCSDVFTLSKSMIRKGEKNVI